MKKIKIILVNLISPHYLVRYQAPMAVNLLSKYIKSKDKSLNIKIVDMQDIYDKCLAKCDNSRHSFDYSLEQAKKRIRRHCKNSKCVVGLSMKFKTVKVTEDILQEFEKSKNILFVLGNIGSTFSYQRLLKMPLFSKAVAVIGEGEDALLTIVKTARKNSSRISDSSLYKQIPNVATNSPCGVCLKCFKRVDLEKYPEIYLKPAQIYDKEWKVHALETSRGCPWGKCTFCSINGQFGGSLTGIKGDMSWKGFPIDCLIRKIRRLVAEGVRVIDVKDSEFFGPMDTEESFRESTQRVRIFANAMLQINRELASKNPKDKLILNHISIRADTLYRENEIKKNAIRKKTYKLLKQAGLKGVYIGIESGSATQLRRYCKGVTVEENKRALALLKELDLEIEPGFIFFDYVANINELQENIAFLEETEMYTLDSRILGSLRAQQGSTYVLMMKNMGLLGKEDPESLGFSCRYRDADVAEIEKIYSMWEASTIDLMKLLTREERLPYYALNFKFLKNAVGAYHHSCINVIPELVEEFCEVRRSLHNIVLDNISLAYAERKEAHNYVKFAISENAKYDLAIKKLFKLKNVKLLNTIKQVNHQVLMIGEE